jgi:hypothetical protein
MVTDLQIVTSGPYSVELSWTASGDDSLAGSARSCFLRGLPGRAIQTEEDWESATLRPASDLAAAAAGQTQSIRVTGLEPDSTYGFSVRYADEHGNLARLSTPFTARTAPAPPPDAGTLEIHLSSRALDGYLGANVVMRMDSIPAVDSLLVDGARDNSYSFDLPPGRYEIRVEQACAILSPTAVQIAEVRSTQVTALSWRVNPVAPVAVTSSPTRGEIWLDGSPTGLWTPDALRCLGPGAHSVTVRLLGAAPPPDDPDSLQTVRPDSLPLSEPLAFRLEPLRQDRGALMEVFTATYCTNCEVADAAAESLWTRLGPDRGYIGVQVHVEYNGSDSLFTPTTGVRTNYYGFGQGVPVAVVGGTGVVRGAGNLGLEAVVNRYLEKIDPVRGTPAPVALYWLASNREPGVRATGRVRVICLEDLSEPSTVRLVAASYKDSLLTRGYCSGSGSCVRPFGHTVREYLDWGTASSRGLARRGDWVDVEVEFRLDNDRRRGGALWSEARMGMIVFMQQEPSKEILQVAHTALP